MSTKVLKILFIWRADINCFTFHVPSYDYKAKEIVFCFAVYRGHIVRKEVIPQIRQRREAALKIQSRVRGHLVRKDVSHKRSKENQSAIMIQKGERLMIPYPALICIFLCIGLAPIIRPLVKSM